MAKFTASVDLSLKDLAWSTPGIVPAGQTVRIPDAIVPWFLTDIVPTIPGGVSWVTQDETSAIASFDPSSKYDKTGGTINGAVTVTGALIAQTSVSTPSLTATAAAFRGKPWFDARAFGATADGVTDDKAAIQSAIDSASAAGGGMVHVPGGTYILASTLTVKANVWLVGNGIGATVFSSNGSPAIKFGTTSYARISDLKIDGSGVSGTSAVLIQITDSNYITVDGCDLATAAGDAIDLANTCTFIDITRNRIRNSGRLGVDVNSAATDVRVIANLFQATGSHAMSVSGQRVLIQANHFSACTDAPQTNASGTDVDYIGNLSTGSLGDAFNSFGKNVNFIGNRVVGCRDTGICCCGSGRSIVQGNFIYLCWNSGINTGGGKKIIISQNLVIASGRNTSSPASNAGIRVRDDTGGTTTSTDVIVTGNLCYDDTTTWPLASGASGQLWGIEVINASGGGAPDNLVIANNILSNNISAAISLSSIGAKVFIWNNLGYNPQNATGVSTPVMPASGTAVQNATGQDVLVYLTGGTVSAVNLGATSAGTATGMTSGSFYLKAGAFIKISYTSTPSWKWFGI